MPNVFLCLLQSINEKVYPSRSFRNRSRRLTTRRRCSWGDGRRNPSERLQRKIRKISTRRRKSQVQHKLLQPNKVIKRNYLGHFKYLGTWRNINKGRGAVIVGLNPLCGVHIYHAIDQNTKMDKNLTCNFFKVEKSKEFFFNSLL